MGIALLYAIACIALKVLGKGVRKRVHATYDQIWALLYHMIKSCVCCDTRGAARFSDALAELYVPNARAEHQSRDCQLVDCEIVDHMIT